MHPNPDLSDDKTEDPEMAEVAHLLAHQITTEVEEDLEEIILEYPTEVWPEETRRTSTTTRSGYTHLLGPLEKECL